MLDELVLTDAEIDAALSRTYLRGDTLVVVHQRRRRGLIAGSLAVVLAAGLAVPFALRDDERVAMTADLAASPAAPVNPVAEVRVPDGFTMIDAGTVRTLDRTSASPSPDGADPLAANVGAAEALTRLVKLREATLSDDLRSVTILLESTTATDRIEQVRYGLVGGTMTIDAVVVSNDSSQPGSPVLRLILPLPAPVPPGTPIRVGRPI